VIVESALIAVLLIEAIVNDLEMLSVIFASEH